MGYVSLLGDCGVCGRLFLSNPEYVPSLRLADGRQLIFCRIRLRPDGSGGQSAAHARSKDEEHA
jgi:hypothetical protein